MLQRAELLTTAEAAEFLDLSPSTLTMWRRRSVGPRYFKFSSRSYRYRRADLESWISQAVNLPKWLQA